MTRSPPPPAPIEPTEAMAAFLVGRGLVWPLARCLAPWVEAIEATHDGETVALLRAVRGVALMMGGWIEDGEAGATTAKGLRAAALASLDLVEALGGGNDIYTDWRRGLAWEALQGFADDLRTARPSPWAVERGLGW